MRENQKAFIVGMLYAEGKLSRDSATIGLNEAIKEEMEVKNEH